MMVPRSFHYQRPPPSPSLDEKKARAVAAMPSTRKKADVRLPAHSPPPTTVTVTASVMATANSITTTTTTTTTTADPVHSKPVVIPQPVRSHRYSSHTHPYQRRHHHGRLPTDHKPDAVPPAVAALLAVTSIPRPPQARRRRAPGISSNRRISIDELIREWRQDDRELSPSGYGSPLDYLLESPDDYDDVSSLEPGSRKEPDLVSIPSMCSLSSESMPSLEADERSSVESWSSPTTPSLRKEKAVTSPPKEDCILDHPLLRFSLDDDDSSDGLEDEPTVVMTKTIRPPPQKQPKSSFKSNLTASLQALKSAAKSFSNFTAPSIPPDDLLTRSLLSPRFTSEMRPRQFQGLPGPALRRYLNPPQTPAPVTAISPSELFHDTLTPQPASAATAPMIQMQTYGRSPSPAPRRRRVDPGSEAGRALGPTPAVRQREPRENADFLRVIVLEMNMRREGKLDAKTLGRARIWLPPRKMEAVEVQDRCGVPARWVGVAIDEI